MCNVGGGVSCNTTCAQAECSAAGMVWRPENTSVHPYECCHRTQPAEATGTARPLKTDDDGSRQAWNGCAASDDNLLLLRQTLCQSIGTFSGFPECSLKARNLSAEGDWPNQAVCVPFNAVHRSDALCLLSSLCLHLFSSSSVLSVLCLSHNDLAAALPTHIHSLHYSLPATTLCEQQSFGKRERTSTADQSTACSTFRYMYDLLHALASPATCLNTTEAQRTVAFLSVVDPAKSPVRHVLPSMQRAAAT